MAIDPPLLKGQQALTLFGLLQKPKVYAEVLPLSDVNAKERLSRTPKGCLGLPREVPDDANAQKHNKKHMVFQ